MLSFLSLHQSLHMVLSLRFLFQGFRSILHHPGPRIQHTAKASAFWSIREPPSGSQALVQVVQAGRVGPRASIGLESVHTFTSPTGSSPTGSHGEAHCPGTSWTPVLPGNIAMTPGRPWPSLLPWFSEYQSTVRTTPERAPRERNGWNCPLPAWPRSIVGDQWPACRFQPEHCATRWPSGLALPEPAEDRTRTPLRPALPC